MFARFFIYMEVPMLKHTRRSLHFDSLEGKVLLSTGMADPAATVHRETAKRFLLNGSLSGLPDGKPGVDGFTETSFPVTGRLASMGAVRGHSAWSNRSFRGERCPISAVHL